MDRPNMRNEVLEALEEYYKNDIEILVDCLRYLKEDDKVFDLGYCTECGAKLIEYHYREYHSEVDAYENMSDLCCPNCDFINNSTEEEGF